MMRPVLTREEYLRWRDSEENRKAEKRQMVQMNYSCMPASSDDGEGGCGPLRGSEIPSNTVGMDIDILRHGDEDEEAYLARLEAIPERVLAKKGELGLLMLERSASKGFHIAFRRREEMTQEENLRWASELLGVEYDKGAKDITRVFYTPADKLLYLDDAIFVNEPAASLPARGVGGASSLHAECAPGRCECDCPSSLPQASSFALHAFDLCAKNAGLKVGEMDIWGEPNWHTNLMAVLSVGLPKLMSREQLLAVVAKRMPNYAQTEDCVKLIEYFYDKYSADKGFMNVALRDINVRAQEMAQNDDRGNLVAEDENKVLDELCEGWEAPVLPRRIPRLMELLVGNYDPRFREMLLLSALPVLSAHASHFRATYLNGKVIGPQQFVAVIGGSGQGKGNCTMLYQEMVRHTLHESDEREWQKVKENAELRDKMANAKERPPKYHPRLRLFETTSKSSILELQTNLGKNGMLLGQFSEVDGLSGTSRAAYSDISVLLRKGWDMDVHRQFYMSDATCNTYTKMSISLLMEGTVKAMLERMFSDTNCEGGLMQRCIPVLVPKSKRTFRPPLQNYLTEEEKKERDDLLIDLFLKDLELGENTQLLDTPLTNRAIGLWFDELEERYNDGFLTEAEADLSHRCGEFMLRAAIPLVALYGKETKEIVDFARWVGESAHYAMCRIFGLRVQKEIQSANELLSQRLDARKTAEPLLDKLPTIFTIQQFRELREKEGQSTMVKMLLSRYCKNGKLERVGKGVYRQTGLKGNMVSVTKMSDHTPNDENGDGHGDTD